MPDEFNTPEGLDAALDQEPIDQGPTALESGGLAELLDGGQGNGEKRRAQQSGDLATLRGDVTNEQVVAQSSEEWSHDTSLAQEAEKLFSELESDLATASVDAITQQPQNSQAITQDLADGVTAINDMRSSPAALELAVIQRAAQVPLKAAAREAAAFNLGARNELAAMLDEQGLMDRILDIGGMFVPARTTLEWEDVKKGVKSDKQLSAFLTGESIAQMITSWQSLPTERKKALYPALAETVFSATGIEGRDIGPIKAGRLTDQNMLLGASMLLRFLDPEGGERASHDQKVDLGLEALSFAPGALKLLKNIDLAAAGAAFKGSKGSPFRPTPKGPVTDGGLNAISNEVAKLPAPTRKAMESVLLSAGEHAAKEHNLVKVVAKAGDLKEAARINLASMSSAEVQRVVGISSDDAVTNAMPFQTNEWLPQAVEGLVPEIGKALNEFYRKAEGAVTNVTSQSNRMRIGATTRVDRANELSSFQKEVDRIGEDILSDGITLSEVRITGENTEAFTFEYTVTDTTNTARTIQGRRSWTAGRVSGDYAATAENLANTPTIPGQSPAAWSMTKPDGTDFNDTVKLAIQVEDLTVAVRNDTAALWIDANKAVSGLGDSAKRQQLNALELEGDEWVNPTTAEKGKVFLPEELHAKGMTDPEVIEAYYKRRLVADAFHSIDNYATRRELELTGFKRSVIVGEGENAAMLFVKPFDEVAQAKSSLQSKVGYGIYDSLTGKIFTATDTHIDQVYDSGRMIVRSHADWNTTGNDLARGGEHVEYIAVPRESVQALPEQVNHYKVGYVPKAHEGIEFVVQRAYPMTKRGSSTASKTEAIRAFSSKLDAQKFMEDQITTHMKVAGVPREVAERLYVMADGSAMSQIERATNSLSGSKGLFTGTRAKDDLLQGLDGAPIERMQPEDVLGRWLDHISTRMTKNEMRIGKEQEWLNTVRRMLPEVELKGFDGTRLPNDETGKALERLRNQLRIWNTVPSRKESLFEASTQRTHDWVLNGSRKLGLQKNAIDSILWLKHAEPTAAVMAANMHTLLGALNPSQLYVQSSAAVIALSLAPIAKVPGIIAKGAIFSMLDNVKEGTATGKIIKSLEKDGELGEGFSEEMYMAWDRSGLRESVKGNADLNYTSSTGIGLSQDVLRKAGNVSLYIYRTAELINRRLSYITAFTEWRTANPSAVIDDAAESDILRIANLYMLELNGANRAWWQGGNGASATQKTAAMATQFGQVLAKTVELTFKGTGRGGFTKAQKARLAAGQLLMFGSAGVPLVSMVGSALVDWMAEKAGLDSTNPEDVELMKALANDFNQGVSGFVAHEMLGAEVDVASRAALGVGVFDKVKDIITSKDPAWVKLLSVTSETGKRVAQAGEDIALLVGQSEALTRLAQAEPMLFVDRTGMERLTKDSILTTAKEVTTILAGIPSTGRNILKQRLMTHQNIIRSRQGRARIKDDFNFMTELGVALGFQPTAESRLRTIEERNFENKEAVQEAVEVMTRTWYRYVYTHNRDASYADTVRATKQLLDEGLGNPVLVEDFHKALENRILENPQTAEDRALLEYFRTTLSGEVTQGLIMDSERLVTPEKVFSSNPVVLPFADTVQHAPKVED